MDLWLKIGWAIVLIMMLVFLYPRAKEWMENGPKAEAGDWQAVLVPLMLVVGFVVLLVMLV
jgi:cytochrome b561